MFDHQKIQTYAFENIPLDRDLNLMDEKWMAEFESALIASVEERGDIAYEVGYYSPASAQAIGLRKPPHGLLASGAVACGLALASGWGQGISVPPFSGLRLIIWCTLAGEQWHYSVNYNSWRLEFRHPKACLAGQSVALFD